MPLDMILRMVRGDTAEFEFHVIHPVTEESVNLTGTDLRFVGRRAYGDPDPPVIDCGLSDITLYDQGQEATKGRGKIKVPASQTDSLEDETVELKFDFQVKEGSTSRWTTARGTLFVYPDVART
jgi:hypothetical protein